jgi:hypothetical protein
MALVLGGADSLHADVEAALRLFKPDLWIATNHAGRDHPGRVDHWCSFHVELLPKWTEERRAADRPDAGQLWTCTRREPPAGLQVRRTENWGGSSGLLAVTVALELGCSRVVLAGVPMTREAAHYDDAKPWRDAGNYRRGWLSKVETMAGRVRSFGGWTAELLGRPDAAWIKGD